MEVVYLALLTLLFYLLVMSRTGEAHTVWEPMHPLFIPILFLDTSILFIILLTSEKTSIKLLLVMAHSILLHSFFSIVLPAGDSSGQQMDLGRIRFAFDGNAIRGWLPPSTSSLQSLFVESLKGLNFQAALSTILARILSIDIFWIHMFLIPALWGIFTPLAAYMIAKTLSKNETHAALSSLVISAFPYVTYFGSVSTPNSLGFLFFYFALYFMLNYLFTSGFKTAFLMVVFAAFSFLMHPLTGITSFAFLILAIAFKPNVKENAFRVHKKQLLLVFLICAILLPLSFTYLRLLGLPTNVSFSLDKFSESSVQEILGLFLFGELIHGFDINTIILIAIGPTLALGTMIYLALRLKRDSDVEFRTRLLFLLTAFLLTMIDYRILKLFMTGLPLNEERLWVFRDMIAAPIVALGVFYTISRLTSLKHRSSFTSFQTANLRAMPKGSLRRILALLFVINALIPLALGGWVTVSLRAAYPEAAPPSDPSKPDYSLQITSYELDAAKYLKDTTAENYVVIGDLWTAYAGETIVGIFNRQAFYFGEFDKRREDLFQRMLNETNSQPMIDAMNQAGTETSLAYFVISKPRLGADQYDKVTHQAQQNGLQTYHILYYPENVEKLRIFFYEKENG
jgi:hypothetical protein